MKRTLNYLLFLILTFLSVSQLYSEIPGKISYQGLATDSVNVPLTGTHTLIIKLYSLVGDQLWSETYSDVSFDNGVFSIILGDNPSNPLPLFTIPMTVGVTIDSYSELQPRQPLTSSPYSFISKTVADSSITASKLAYFSVTTNNIADNSITTSKIQDSAVTTSKIQNNAVSTLKIQDSAVTSPKIANLAVQTNNIADGAISETKLTDHAVTGIKIAAGAVEGGNGAGNIASGTIANSDIGQGEIHGSGNAGGIVNIAEYSIAGSGTQGTDIYPGSIGTAELSESSVTSDRIADQSVVKSLNNIQDNVSLVGGTNISITPSASTHSITISSSLEQFDGILNNTPLVINNPSGNAKITLNPDGTSLLTGVATFSNGIHILSNGVTFSDGTVLSSASSNAFNGILNNLPLIINNSSGSPKITLNTDGSSLQTGLASYNAGIQINGSGNGLRFPDGTLLTSATTSNFNGILNNTQLIIYNAQGNPRITLNPDGTSIQTGIANFASGIHFTSSGSGVTFSDGTFFNTANFNFSQLNNGSNSNNLQIQGSLAPTGTGVIVANSFIGTGSTSNAVDLATGEVNGILPVANGGTNSAAVLNNNRIMVSKSGQIVEGPAMTNGQLLIGSTSASPTTSTLTGTVNQVNVTNGAGSIVLSTPQDIASISSPTFSSLTLTNKATSASTLSTDGSSTLTTKDYVDTKSTNIQSAPIITFASSSNLTNNRVLAQGNGISLTNSGTDDGNLTIDVLFAGSGTATTASRSDHTHPNMITGTGSNSQIAFFNGSNSISSVGNLTWIANTFSITGNVVATGTSILNGTATFGNGIQLTGSGNGIKFPDGTSITSLSSVTFNGILNNSPLIIKDGSGNSVIELNTDGTSYNLGTAEFANGINITNGSITFLDGTSQITAGLNPALNQGHIYVGNSINLATDVAVSGDVTIASNGHTTIANNAVNSAKIQDGSVAPVDLQAGSVGQFLVTTGTNTVQWSSSIPGRQNLSTSTASTAAAVASSTTSIVYYTGTATLSSSNLPSGNEGDVLYLIFQTGQTTGFNSTVVASGGGLHFVYVSSAWHLLY